MRWVAQRSIVCAAFLFCVISLSACHSYHIETTITNRTGGNITLLEMDYPSASFGADTLALNREFPYRIQTRGSGAVKIQYTAANGHPVQITGPTLYEHQEGHLEVILMPDGKAEFHPSLNPAH